MANRNRPIQVKFRVTPEERAMIDRRMEQADTINMAAYLRKMAIDGYVVKLELPELRDFFAPSHKQQFQSDRSQSELHRPHLCRRHSRNENDD